MINIKIAMIADDVKKVKNLIMDKKVITKIDMEYAVYESPNVEFIKLFIEAETKTTLPLIKFTILKKQNYYQKFFIFVIKEKN